MDSSLILETYCYEFGGLSNAFEKFNSVNGENEIPLDRKFCWVQSENVKPNTFETRIELISPGLRKRMDSASEAQLRHIATSISRAVVERVGLENPIITRALEELARPQLVKDFQPKVQALADDLDSSYLNLSALCDEGSASRQQVTVAFSKARAASAVAFAFNDNAIMAASEVTYEAASAIDDAKHPFVHCRKNFKRWH